MYPVHLNCTELSNTSDWCIYFWLEYFCNASLTWSSAGGRSVPPLCTPFYFISLPIVASSVVRSVIASRVARREERQQEEGVRRDWRQQEEGVRNSQRRRIMLSRSKHKVNVGLRSGCVSDVTEESSGASNSSINNLPSDDPPAYSSDHPQVIKLWLVKWF